MNALGKGTIVTWKIKRDGFVPAEPGIRGISV